MFAEMNYIVEQESGWADKSCQERRKKCIHEA